MKRFTFILAALFAATFANAQITLEHTFESNNTFCRPAASSEYEGSHHAAGDLQIVTDLPCSFFYEEERVSNGIHVNFFNVHDYTLYKSIDLTSYGTVGPYEDECLVCGIAASAYDIYAVNKLAGLIHIYAQGYKVIDEDKNTLLEIPTEKNNRSFYRIDIIKMGGNWYLIAYWNNESSYLTEVYSLPGDGSEPQITNSVSTPSSPMRSARKIARDGQVLIETETNTYSLQGAEVK